MATVGHVKVTLAREGPDFVLSVSDNGVGQSQEGRTGLGTRLVSVFASQLGGTAIWEAGASGGCTATIRFPTDELQLRNMKIGREPTGSAGTGTRVHNS
jgi:two-component sensor histidine kinase